MEMAPYKENRFQRLMRRFSRYYYAKYWHPLLVLGGLWMVFMPAYLIVGRMGHEKLALGILVAFWVVSILSLLLVHYGMILTDRKLAYEVRVRQEELLSLMDEMTKDRIDREKPYIVVSRYTK